MNQISISELSDAACEAFSGGLSISVSVKKEASGDTIVASTPNDPPAKVYDGGPLEYTAPTFPGSSGVDNRNAVFKLTN